ncbi:MAG TPA: DoxX family protein [Gemmatimonadales bacterium]|nr:DoxX family protein [Gemmatimonadales bacterium]
MPALAPMAAARRSRALHISLWIVQVLLAAAFLMAGTMKLSQPIDALAPQMPWVTAVPAALVRFIGAAELAGALGLLLPSLTRLQPRLTALAALGLVAVMVLASAFHLSRGEGAMVPMNLVLAALAAFVAWGRGKAAPITPRGA